MRLRRLRTAYTSTEGKVELTLRHAAALALVGWYLLVPPYQAVGHGWVVSYDSPMSEWKVSGTFQSFDECHAKWISDAVSRLSAFQNRPRKQWQRADYEKYVAMRAFLDAQCAQRN
jgi:hypothetical protein